jgi:hypothetical protein
MIIHNSNTVTHLVAEPVAVAEPGTTVKVAPTDGVMMVTVTPIAVGRMVGVSKTQS